MTPPMNQPTEPKKPRQNCILNVESPSFPPSNEERRQCGCEDCNKYLHEVSAKGERLFGSLYVDEQNFIDESGNRFHRTGFDPLDDRIMSALRVCSSIPTSDLSSIPSKLQRLTEAESELGNEIAFNEGWQEHISDLLDAMKPFVFLTKENTWHIPTAFLRYPDWCALSKAFDAAVSALHSDGKAPSKLQALRDAEAKLAEARAALQEWVDYFDSLNRRGDEADPLYQARLQVHGERVQRSRNAIASALKSEGGVTP